MNKTDRGRRRYYIELVGAMALCLASIYARRFLNRASPALHFVIAAGPVLPIGLMAAAALRFSITMDEFVRQRVANITAIGSYVTLLFVMCWAFLRGPFHLPGLPLFAAIPLLTGAWTFVGVIISLRDAIQDQQVMRAIWPYGAAIGLGFIACLYVFASRPTEWPFSPLLLFGTMIWIWVWLGFFVFSKRREP